MQAAKRRDRCCAVGGGQAEGLASAVLQNQQQLLESLDVSQGFDPPLSNAPPPVPAPPQVLHLMCSVPRQFHYNVHAGI